MKPTIDHLITLRFEVIADYPKSKFEVGSILSRVKNATNDWYDVGDARPDLGIIQKQELIQYPHLFRPLNWWEDRTEDEMPKYLKIDINKEGFWDYSEVKRWDMKHTLGILDDSNPRKLQVCDILCWTPDYTYQPCSEEEYLANQ